MLSSSTLVKKILQLRATEVPQNLLPIRWFIKAAQVGLLLTSQKFQGGRLANTIGTNYTQDLVRQGLG